MFRSAGAFLLASWVRAAGPSFISSLNLARANVRIFSVPKVRKMSKDKFRDDFKESN
jgi:hypothetical protein